MAALHGRWSTKDTRWKDLPGNTTYPVNKSILITSTDVRKSNSAAMYLALASATSPTATTSSRTTPQVDAIVDPAVAAVPAPGLRGEQLRGAVRGLPGPGHGQEPDGDDLRGQFIARAAANDGSITPDMVLMYPEPTIFSKHTFVGLTPDGIRLGEFLTDDPEHAHARDRVRLPDDRHRRASERSSPTTSCRVPDQPHRRHRAADLRDPRGDDHAPRGSSTPAAACRRRRPAVSPAIAAIEPAGAPPMTDPSLDLEPRRPTAAAGRRRRRPRPRRPAAARRRPRR